MRQMFYRPILPLVADLIATPHFLDALTYERSNIYGDEHVYRDILDGSIPNKHLNEIDEQYSRCCNRYSSKPTKVNILLSEFYDAGQLFKRKLRTSQASL